MRIAYVRLDDRNGILAFNIRCGLSHLYGRSESAVQLNGVQLKLAEVDPKSALRSDLRDRSFAIFLSPYS